MFSPRFRISALAFSALFCLVSVLAVADSHVRIVRLSYIEGGVLVSNAGAQTYRRAMVNLPIAEGMNIRTADDGRAEIEFEDGSTLRIAPDSVVTFPRLSLRDSGTKASEVAVLTGTAYVNFLGMKDNDFTIDIGGKQFALQHAAHLRADVNAKGASVSVFKGLVQVDGPAGAMDVKKGQTVEIETSDAQLKLAKNIHQEAWDSWDDQQNEYHERYAAKSYNSYSPYAYGTTDLSYYGSFFNYSGYGMLWQPYFAGAGWDPFMDGAWMFYPGWGYGWVSAYPWGWTPYHYGSWVFVSGYGWAWQPGGVWNTWYGQPVVLNAPKGYIPPHAPLAGTGTVFVSRGTPSLMAGSKMVIRNNSAGLGVPRGSFQNMAKLSQKVQEHGTISQRVSMEPIGSGRAPEPRMSGMSRGPAPMPSMPAPPSHSSSSAPPGPRR